MKKVTDFKFIVGIICLVFASLILVSVDVYAGISGGDNFVRANSTTLGKNWTETVGTSIRIEDNSLKMTTGTDMAFYNLTDWWGFNMSYLYMRWNSSNQDTGSMYVYIGFSEAASGDFRSTNYFYYSDNKGTDICSFEIYNDAGTKSYSVDTPSGCENVGGVAVFEVNISDVNSTHRNYRAWKQGINTLNVTQAKGSGSQSNLRPTWGIYSAEPLTINNLYIEMNGTEGGSPPPDINYTLYVNATSIYSATGRTDSDIQGFCYGTSDGNTTVTNYYYRWFHDGILNNTGNITATQKTTYINNCMQETANISAPCSGFPIGNYFFYGHEPSSGSYSDLVDGDITTYAIGAGGLDTTGIDINYSIPFNFSGNKILNALTDIGNYNETIEKYCPNLNQTIQLRMELANIYPQTSFYCWNTSDWKMITTIPSATLYEERIFFNGTANANMTKVNNITAISGNTGKWIFSCLASNGSINSTWVNTTTLDITGFISPDITINPSSFFYINYSFINNATASAALLNATFTDDYDLYAYEVIIKNSSGAITYYYSNESLSGASIRTVTKSLQLNNTEGWYSITVNVTDSHTANEIGVYTVDKSKDSLEYNKKIKIKAEGAIESQTEKSKDRYSFEFKYPAGITKKVYYLESNKKLTYLRGSHFVDFENKQWVDFEGEEGEIKIIKESDKRYRIELSNTETELKFNSIGGLNTNSVTYHYYLLNPPVALFIIPTSFSNNLNQSRPNMQVSINITGNFQNYTRIELYNVSWQLIDNVTYYHAVNGTSIIYHGFNFSSNSSHKFYINATTVDKVGNKKIPTKSGYSYVKYIEAKEPTIRLNITIPSSFGILNATTTIQCMHEWDSYLNYSAAFNDNFMVLRYNQSNGTIISNTTNLAKDGANTLEGVCWSEYGTAIDSYTTNLYLKTIFLWDEKENKPFDCLNISGCKLYFDDNSTLFDFWNTSNSTSFSSLGSNKLRLELLYPSGTIITRYLDVSLFENNITLCANKNGITHYQQVIYSAISQPVFLKNVYSGCAVAADYTRFGYEDALTLNAYTINMPYYLYIYEDGIQVMLSSLDGSIASDINIDTLIFKAHGFNINEVTKGVGIQKVGADLFYIYYKNLNNNSKSVEVSIMDIGQSITLVDLDTTSFTNPNEWSLYFDTSLYTNMTNSTVFKLTITSTDEEGKETILEKVFNYAGSTGVLKSAVGFVIALLVTIFGFSFVSTKSTFSFFGILIIIISLGILYFSIPTWYITMMAAIDVIMLIYTIIMLVMMNHTEVIK